MRDDIIDYLGDEVAKQYGYEDYTEFYYHHDKEVVYEETAAIEALVK